MNIYLHTILALSCMYFTYMYGRNMTRGEIAAEVAEKTINKLEREGFVKLIFNKKTGEKDFVRFK